MNDDGYQSTLVTAAISAHEMFRAYLEAGFTEDQAIRLLAAQITEGGRGSE